MGGDETDRLVEDVTTHEEGDAKHGPRKILGLETEDEEVDHGFGLVDTEYVRKGHGQGGHESHRAENVAANHLEWTSASDSHRDMTRSEMFDWILGDQNDRVHLNRATRHSIRVLDSTYNPSAPDDSLF